MSQENNSQTLGTITTTYKKYDVYFQAKPNRTGTHCWIRGAYSFYAVNESDATQQAIRCAKDWFKVDVDVVHVNPL